MDPVKVLRMAQSLGGTLGRVILVGCEPATFGPEHEGHMGLSAPVEAAVDEAVQIIEAAGREHGGAMERDELNNANDARDLLFMFGGAALCCSAPD